MAVTSIAIIPLENGDTVENHDTAAAKLLHGRISDVLKASGVRRCYWGRAVEDPHLLYFVTDWDSLQKHIDFVDNPQDDSTDLSPLFARPPTVYHVELAHPDLRATLSKPISPVTEVVAIYFPLDISATAKSKVVSDTKMFRDACQGPAGCKAHTAGWVVEDIDIPGQDEKGKAFVMMLGWDSIEAHNDCVKTPRVQEHVHLIAGLGQKALSMQHVSLNKVEP